MTTAVHSPVGYTHRTRRGRYIAVCLRCSRAFRVEYTTRSQALALLTQHDLEDHGPGRRRGWLS